MSTEKPKRRIRYVGGPKNGQEKDVGWKAIIMNVIEGNYTFDGMRTEKGVEILRYRIDPNFKKGDK